MPSNLAAPISVTTSLDFRFRVGSYRYGPKPDSARSPMSYGGHQTEKNFGNHPRQTGRQGCASLMQAKIIGNSASCANNISCAFFI